MKNGTLEFSVQRLVKFDGEGSLKAYVDLTIANEVVVRGVRVIEGKHGLFVSMPRQQGKDSKWYDNIVLLTKDTQKEVGRVVLDAYQQEMTGAT